MVTNLQMGLEGTGVQAIGRPRPDRDTDDWYGLEPAPPESIAPALEGLGRSGVRPRHSTSCAPPISPVPSRFVAESAPRRLRRVDGTAAEGATVGRPRRRRQLKATRRNRTTTQALSEPRRVLRRRGRSTATSEEFRADAHRVDAASARGVLASAASTRRQEGDHLLTGAEASRFFFGPPARDLEPGRGLPVRDADLSARARCSTPAPGAARRCLKLAARQIHERGTPGTIGQGSPVARSKAGATQAKSTLLDFFAG